VSIDIVFETHATTEDNEGQRATGWLPGRLSAAGRDNAVALGRRRRNDGLAAVFSSDLARALQTVEIAFSGTSVPCRADWRLRECDYGSMNGGPASTVHGNRLAYFDDPYPGGESWRQATQRVGCFLDDLRLRWDSCRVLIVGHVATRWGLECSINGAELSDLMVEDFAWKEGWEFRLP
jgi:2,3-bisphosphoglycerate-dependent phosphoglycerate mutase